MNFSRHATSALLTWRYTTGRAFKARCVFGPTCPSSTIAESALEQFGSGHVPVQDFTVNQLLGD
jgi:putative component of membrane protein insertase Oxa1/YidC/SpoIIIJ protein YidD